MPEWDTDPLIMKRLRDSIAPVKSDRSLRDVLGMHFPDECGRLPIEGGWGYSQDDPIVFVRELFGKRKRLNFVELEKTIAKHIICEELIIEREAGNGFSGISVEKGVQALVVDGARQLDRISFDVHCWSDLHWRVLKEEWELSARGTTSGFDRVSHFQKRESAKIEFQRVFWFDVTSMQIAA